MKTFFRRLFRAALYIVIIIVLLAFCSVLLLRSQRFVSAVVLPRISDATGYAVTLDSWRCRPWASLDIGNLVIRQVLPATANTAMVVRVERLSCEYDLFSLFGDTPVINRLVIVNPVIGLAGQTGSVLSAAADGRKSSPAGTASGPLPPLPLLVKSLVFSNAFISYTDSSGRRAQLDSFSGSLTNFGPRREGSCTLNGIFRYQDTNSLHLERMPVALVSSFSFRESSLPSACTLLCTATNSAGRAGTLDLAPLSSVLSFSFSKDYRAPILRISSCNVDVLWSNSMLGHLSVTGSLNLVSTDFTVGTRLDIKASPLWQALSGLDNSIDISQSDCTLNLAASHNAETKEVSTRGSLALKSLIIPSNASAGPLDFSAVFTNTYNFATRTLQLPSLSVFARQSSTSFLRLKTEKPLTLCFDTMMPASVFSGKVTTVSAQLENIGLQQLSPLLKRYGLTFRDGSLSSTVVCDITGTGENVSLRGSLKAQNLDCSYQDAAWRNCDLDGAIAFDITNRQLLTISRCTLNTRLWNQPAGECAAGGFYNLITGSNRLAFAVTGLKSGMIIPLLAPHNSNTFVYGLSISLQALTENRDRRAQESSAKLIVKNNPAAQPREWDSINLQLKTSLSSSVFSLAQCDLVVAPSPFQQNSLSATGVLYITPENRPGHFDIYSRFFDATGLLNTFMPATREPVIAILSTGKTERIITKEPQPLHLDNRVIQILTRIDHLNVRELEFEPLHVDTLISNNILTVATRNVVINDGTFSLNGSADLGVTGYVYQAIIVCTNLPVMPVMNSLLPGQPETFNGRITSRSSFEGRGITRPNIIRYFIGETDTHLRDGQLRNAPILKQLGDTLRYKALKHLSFEHGRFLAKMKNGIVSIQDSGIDSETIKAGMRGTMSFDKELDMKFMLGMSGSEIMQFISSWVPQDKMSFMPKMTNFYQFPVIPITGTLDNPHMPSAEKLFKDVYATVGQSALSVMQTLIDNKGIDKIKDVFKDDNLKKNIEGGLDLFKDIFKKPDSGKQQPQENQPEQSKQPYQFL